VFYINNLPGGAIQFLTYQSGVAFAAAAMCPVNKGFGVFSAAESGFPVRRTTLLSGCYFSAFQRSPFVFAVDEVKGFP
jgi:hypothetical protein